jgi:UPF0176 protein
MTIVTSFYKFVDLPNYHELKEPWLTFCNEQGIKGTILLAHEGINGSVSGNREMIDAFYNRLKAYKEFGGVDIKENPVATQPFQKMKVRLKKEIVSLGVNDLDMSKIGDYVAVEEWDEFISRDDVITIDTRNDYECEVGTFKGAVDPKTKNFKEFPKWLENHMDDLQGKKVAMFCTGGIRCEKSTALLKNAGLQEVYHLKGGILNYLAQTKNPNKKWQGQCFVFDDRAVVDDNLLPSEVNCSSCGKLNSRDDITHRRNQKRIYCAECFDSLYGKSIEQI